MNEKKIVILVGDGMADYPIDSLNGKTVLEAARTPNMDFIAQNGIVGLVRTVPLGMEPGSDVANLSILGYNPCTCYSGRAPFEAINLGIDLSPQDVAFRMNIVTIEKGIMKDFSANHIASEFSKAIINEISSLKQDSIEFYPGVSYRNIMVWRNFPFDPIPQTTPPHDIQGKEIMEYLPRGNGAEKLISIMEKAHDIIIRSKNIENLKFKYKGHPTHVWLWGGGRKPHIQILKERFGLFGFTIAAVDLIHGIGRAVGLEPIKVEGATGYLDTNYEGKAYAALEGITRANFVLCHVESPDESGHEGNLAHKIKAIEDFDSRLVAHVLEGLNRMDNWTLLVLPDHPTPISLRTHTADPVPFAILKKTNGKYVSENVKPVRGFCENCASATGIFIENGHELIEWLIA